MPDAGYGEDKASNGVGGSGIRNRPSGICPGDRMSAEQRGDDDAGDHDQDCGAEDRHSDLTGRVLRVFLCRAGLRLPAHLLLFLTWFL